VRFASGFIGILDKDLVVLKVVCYGIGISKFVEGVHVCLQGVTVFG